MRTFIFPILVLGLFSIVLTKPIPLPIIVLAKVPAKMEPDGSPPSPLTPSSTPYPTKTLTDGSNLHQLNEGGNHPQEKSPSASTTGIRSGTSNSDLSQSEERELSSASTTGTRPGIPDDDSFQSRERKSSSASTTGTRPGTPNDDRFQLGERESSLASTTGTRPIKKTC
ncbi:hypothetical protein FB446DRAFT_293531 [Lentinula raphanica]|nr:hypothetical protein FB446DRAFT_293531 [Lentinula raphanica]